MKAKQFLVLGAGRFGTAVASTLYQLGHEVVIIDESEAAIEDIMTEVTHALIEDATDPVVLSKIGAQNFDTIIVAIGANLEANILATVAAKEMGCRHVISKAKDDMSARVLQRVGADEVIRPEHDTGVQLAENLAAPNVLDELRLGERHDVVEVVVDKHLIGTLMELQLPKRFGVTIITINREDDVIVSPPADFSLQNGDRVLLLGETEGIDKLRAFLAT